MTLWPKAIITGLELLTPEMIVFATQDNLVMVNMAFGQRRFHPISTWGVAPGYGQKWPSAKHARQPRLMAKKYP
jgi:hypothetical protein